MALRRAAGVDLKEHVDAQISAFGKYFEALLLEKSLRDQQRYDAQIKALDAALLAAEKAVQTALTAAEKAVTKAEMAAEKRFESVNEFRQTLSDQASTFISRDQFEATADRLRELAAKLDKIEGRAGGYSSSWQTLVSVVLVVGAVVAIVVKM